MTVINGIGEYAGSNQRFINGSAGYWVMSGDFERGTRQLVTNCDDAPPAHCSDLRPPGNEGGRQTLLGNMLKTITANGTKTQQLAEEDIAEVLRTRFALTAA